MISFAQQLARVMARAGGIIILVIAFVVAIDVVLRQVFHSPIGGVEEHAGYALAIASAWGFADAFIRRTHIRIDVAYRLMPAALRILLDLVALLVLLALSSYLGWLALNVWLVSVDFGARSVPPLFIPMSLIQGLWVAGILVFILVMAMTALAVGRAFVRGNLASVQHIIAPPAAHEEIAEELESLRRRQAGGA